MAEQSAVEWQGEEWESPPAKLELGILVLDGSGSMRAAEPGTGLSKAQAVELHLVGQGQGEARSLLQRLKDSTRANEIQLSVITFDHRVRRALEPTPVTRLDPGALKLNLLENHGGMTAIGLALEEAAQVARTFLEGEQEGVPRYVLILLMTDGKEEGPQTNDPNANPVTVASRIKESARDKRGRPDIVIAAAAYGQDADEETLRKIVTSPLTEGTSFFKRVNSGEELREFFMASMQVVERMTA